MQCSNKNQIYLIDAKKCYPRFSNKNRQTMKKVSAIHRFSVSPYSHPPPGFRIVRGKFVKLASTNSFSPAINRNLITLKTNRKFHIKSCNFKPAFQLSEPLKIKLGMFSNGKKTQNCLPYDHPKVIRFLKRNLRSNKHINPKQIIMPKQNDANCWFNSFFAIFFISDKGRKFFHFFRQLMIESKIPPKSKISNAFALLNYAVDASISGSPEAIEMNTNAIIKLIYDSLSKSERETYNEIYKVNEPGNPFAYYIAIMSYLNAHAVLNRKQHNLNILFHPLQSSLLATFIDLPVQINYNYANHITANGYPDIIVIQFSESDSENTVGKRIDSFELNSTAKYHLDSIVLRDVKKNHFCSLITCEGRQFAFDGASHSRLVEFKWKKWLNYNQEWSFIGTTVPSTGERVTWNFSNGYYLMFYYRI